MMMSRDRGRQPVLFLGHGSPMNVIEDNEFRRGWQSLGAQFGPGGRWSRPALILCVSAHWLTEGWWLTGMAQPRTIHDFGGFPPALYAQQYPAPGAPAQAQALAAALQRDGGMAVGVDEQEWGYDHGSWGVLLPMFPQADIPVIQLSLDYDRPPGEHYALGRWLAAWRDQGVLIVASGNIVHNLPAMRRGTAPDQAYDWVVAFDERIAQWIAQGQLDQLPQFQQLGELARLAHPTYEHFLPLLHAAGAADPGEAVEFFNVGMQGASISMRCVVWG